MGRRTRPKTEREDLLQEDLLQLAGEAGLDAQKKSFVYTERHEDERQAFLQELEGVPVEARVYVDEAGVDETLNYA